jgi:hypothetical protein
MEHVKTALVELAKLLEEVEIDYAVMGGFAVRTHGLPRATYDLDFVVALSDEQLSELTRLLPDHGFELPPPYRDGWRDTVAEMPLIKATCYFDGESFAADLFIADNDFLRSAMKRRMFIECESREMWVVSPEDLILMKVVASRPRDLADIYDIRVMQPVFDLEYLREWAGRLGIGEQFEKVWIDSTPEETW